MRKKILSLVFSGIILFGSCVSAKPSWEYKEPPTTLLEAIGVNEKENKTLNKRIWKTLVFSTISFMIYRTVEHNNIKYGIR
tara:strand:+ start:9345 stop:9587 length:243 start_codon:yes stop_codon:yes gene_type:complete